MSQDITDQTTTDDTDETKPEASAEDSLVAQLQADVLRFRDLALRNQADLENFRKRAAREKEDAVKFANAAFLERFIPILDNFELGLNAARAGAENSPILLGMDMVAKQLTDFLTASGVEPVNGEGQPFDPNLHEAVAQEASATVAEGVIVRQLRRGYKLRERLLRPATVVVSKGAPQAE
ncbi:MAG: nucleotide exchange factor GrpE [Verrucomicrobia bacterium]|jgi:molecular chaperone GrpE|nr:MAG: nucleotide exchange factor GrpE [Verrucomicrobiota bacterium]